MAEREVACQNCAKVEALRLRHSPHHLQTAPGQLRGSQFRGKQQPHLVARRNDQLIKLHPPPVACFHRVVMHPHHQRAEMRLPAPRLQQARQRRQGRGRMHHRLHRTEQRAAQTLWIRRRKAMRDFTRLKQFKLFRRRTARRELLQHRPCLLVIRQTHRTLCCEPESRLTREFPPTPHTKERLLALRAKRAANGPDRAEVSHRRPERTPVPLQQRHRPAGLQRRQRMGLTDDPCSNNNNASASHNNKIPAILGPPREVANLNCQSASEDQWTN